MPKPKWQSWLLLGAISLIWGSSFILMKKGLLVFDAYQVASMRVSFAALALLPLLPLSLSRVRKDQVPLIFLVGVLGSGIPPYFFTIAQTHIDSAATGIFNALTPIFTFVFGILLFKTTFNLQKLAGVALGFVGASSLLLLSNHEAVNVNAYGLFVVAATMLYGFNVNIIKTRCQNIDALALTAISYLMLAPFAATHLFTTDFIHLLQHQEGAWTAFGFILILAIIGTAFATVLFFVLTQLTDALFAAMVTYIIPIVAVGWGFLDGETISWTYLFGLALILAGVYLASRKTKAQKNASET